MFYRIIGKKKKEETYLQCFKTHFKLQFLKSIHATIQYFITVKVITVRGQSNKIFEVKRNVQTRVLKESIKFSIYFNFLIFNHLTAEYTRCQIPLGMQTKL